MPRFQCVKCTTTLDPVTTGADRDDPHTCPTCGWSGRPGQLDVKDIDGKYSQGACPKLPMTSQQYADVGGAFCPRCGDDDIDCPTGRNDGTEGMEWREMVCPTCHATWREITRVVGYEALTIGDV